MKNKRKYDVIIFDIDETLVESDYTNIDRFKRFFINNKIKLEDTEKIKKQLFEFIMTFEQKFQNIYVTNDKILDSFSKCCSFISEYNLDTNKVFDEVMDSAVYVCHMINGADKLLENLKQKGYVIVALTNWLYDIQVKKLKKAGLDKYFSEFYCIDNSYLKPSKYSFNRILSKYKCNDCIMIGDTYEYDIIGAKNVGIDSIWYNVKNIKVENNVADYEVNNYNEISCIL